MTLKLTMPEDHELHRWYRVSTRTSFITGKRKYVAFCSCGWEDPYEHSTEQGAIDSGLDHIAAITRGE